jgi:hypothetical protein
VNRRGNPKNRRSFEKENYQEENLKDLEERKNKFLDNF